jgi:hypothetical protein
VAGQRIGTNLLQLRWNVPQEKTADFEAWYDEEHLADMAAVPGILGGRRFARVRADFSSPTEFGFLTLYQLADLGALSRPEFQKLVDDPSPWTRRVAFDLGLSRTVYERIGTGASSSRHESAEQPIGTALLHVMMAAEPSVLDDFHSWYEEEHVPALLGAPGVLSARRFAAVPDDSGYNGENPEADFGFLAIYELADAHIVNTPAFREAGAPTPRRKALGTAVRSHIQVYQQVFPKEGAFEGSGS